MLLFGLTLACSEYNVNDKLPDAEDGAIDTAEPAAPSEPSSPPEPSQEPSDPNSQPSSEPSTEPSAEPSSEPTEGFIPDDSSTSNDPLTGNVVTILMALSNQWLDPVNAEILMLNSIDYVSPTTNPNVLVIRDDNTNGEDEIDSENIYNWIVNAGYSATFLEEPESGIQTADLTGYHVVILSNPGFPADDLSTVEAMRSFSQQGFGIIFQGDDITNFEPDRPLMESLTRLEFIDNGIQYEGYTINDNEGSAYGVTVNPVSPIASGMSTLFFVYGNDIDTTTPTTNDNSVVAWCTVDGTTLPSKPVITAYQP